MSIISVYRSLVVSRYSLRMFSMENSYEDAVHKLNSLQSNKATIDQALKEIKSGKKCTNVEDMENYLMRTGVTLSKLDQLSVIHVAGTKGKGSTSAMCESILRHHGYRTGFYSSPHLVAVRERIRLDGCVISEEKFARYFHQVYEKLNASKVHYDGNMPKYFAFLTVLAFNVFLKEKVDVAIVEVGIGGVVDATNVLRKVPVVGITSLGLDHISILGDKLSQIAAAKAGIMKPGCEAYTVTQQPEAMQVLTEVAQSVKCSLNIVPDYNTYTFLNGHKRKPRANLEAYQSNASLAIQLAHSWMRLTKETIIRANNPKKESVFSRKTISQLGFKDLEPLYVTNDQKYETHEDMVTQIPKETVLGLEQYEWPGRYQVIDAAYATFYLDGAHTKESMEICAKWFSETNRSREKVLIFSATGDRNAELLLNPLKHLEFSHIYFVIPRAYKNTTKNNDNYSFVEHKELLARCNRNLEAWEHLQAGKNNTNMAILESVSEAILNIKNINKPSVLVTGSLHLVGAALSIIDPNLSGKSDNTL